MGPSLSLWSHLLHLSVLLLLANFNPALCTCRPGNGDECIDAPFVPGHDLVGEGFDIVKMQRKRAYTIDVQTYLGKDDRCQLCVNDEMDNELQKLPLSVVDWRSISRCNQHLHTAMYSSATELVKNSGTHITNDWKVGLGLEKFGVGAKAEIGMGRSNVARFAFRLAKEDLYTFAIHEFNCTYYSFRVSKGASPSKEFAQDVSRLPKEYNKQRYKQLINTYGTHYLEKVELGGRIRTVSAIRTCIASLNGQHTRDIQDCLTAQLSLTFPLKIINPIVSPKAEVCSSLSNSNSRTFTSTHSYVHQITEMVPGDVGVGSLSASFNDSTGFDIWMDQLKEDPGMVSYSLTPLPMLISDEVIKGNVKTAIQQYLKDNANPSDSETFSCKSANCCPKEPYRGKLSISLKATGLEGDWWSATNAYATVQYAGDLKKTRQVESDNPNWGTLDFGDVHTINPSLTVTVFDDDWWRQEWLGSFDFHLTAGSTKHETRRFGSSTITISYTLTCDDHLGGDLCGEYKP